MSKVNQRRRSHDAPPAAAPRPAAAGTGRGWRRHIWRLMAIWGLTFIAYSNSFQGALVFDSGSVIGEDPRIRQATPQNIESILRGGYWYGSGERAAHSGLYRPLTTLSYLVNYSVLGNGPRPTGYHAVNFVLHEVNVALVYALGLLMFAETWPALALAAIWGLHPLLTESVTNIVGRADLLAAFGVLAGLFCHIKSASAEGRRRVAWLACLAAAQAIGVFSKENAAVLPGVMLLYDLTCSGRATWRRRILAYAAAALPIAVFFYMRSAVHAHLLVEFTENPLIGAGFWTARITAFKVIGMGVGLFLWPAHLSADYTYNAIPLFGWRPWDWEDGKALLALALCLSAAALAVLLAIRAQRASKWPIFFVVFFFIALLPTSNLIVPIGSIMAERFLYLPLVGLAGCLVAAIQAAGQRLALDRRAARGGWALLGLVCLASTARTYARNFDWQDDRSLWASAVAACPGAARPHYNLGLELERLPDRLPEAIAEYQAALRIEPDFVEAHNNLANALAQMPGRVPEAILEYQVALRIRPGLAAAHYNLAQALRSMPNRLPDAIAEYQAALRIRPDYAEAHDGLADALARIPGRLPEAIAEYRAVLQFHPDRPEAHYNLATALSAIPDRLPEAIAEYRAALRIEPAFVEAHVNLANTLARSPGRLPEALAEYEAALSIRPDPALQGTVDRMRAWLQRGAAGR